MRGPADPHQTADWRRARRQVERTSHPDRGGDPEVYLRRLAEVDRRFGVLGAPRLVALPGSALSDTRPGRRARVRRRIRTVTRASRRALRAVRGRLPRGVPGARRYIDL